ncbi:MAG: terpene cyclase/mutase family protein [Pirellulales bacterium]|nr:terpene cyclase/mutase family protein [Pirellulales bacterium]
MRQAPPWLISMVVHMLVLIAAGLWMMFPPHRPAEVKLEVVADRQGEQLDDDSAQGLGDETAPEEIIALSPLPEVDDPFSAPPNLDVSIDGMYASSDIGAPAIGNALDGRQAGSKEVLLKAYGGTGRSEGAVGAALKWLAKQQRDNGTWSLKGPYEDGGGFENVAAATAMAMLAFQGAGHTHVKDGSYRRVMAKAVEALIAMQDDRGSFFEQSDAPQNNRFYTQGQATIAICELYAMTQESQLRLVAERAVRYLLTNQDPGKGGWRYLPGQDSDLSVTGWVVMALQSARMGGIEVPSDALLKVEDFLNSVSKEKGSRYSYTPGGTPSEVMTAEGLLCRQYLGWDRSDERLQRGVEFLLLPENLPSWKERNVYYWYYATQVLHHMEGDAWQDWNPVMRDLLVDKQMQNGPEAGSWHPTQPEADRWGYQGGRLYTTCLSTYILEVYYRHLPIYSTAVGRPQ